MTTERSDIVDMMYDICRPRAANFALPKTCPLCNSDPGLARRVNEIWLVGCESDECPANPQFGGRTVDEAWLAWNKTR